MNKPGHTHLGLFTSAVLLSSVIGIGFLTSNAYATFPGTNGKIAFGNERDGNMEIHVMNPDGSGQTILTNAPATDASPSWSPDEKKIVFSRSDSGSAHLYIMNSDVRRH